MKPVVLNLTVPELEPRHAEILAEFFVSLGDALWQQAVAHAPWHPEANDDLDDPS